VSDEDSATKDGAELNDILFQLRAVERDDEVQMSVEELDVLLNLLRKYIQGKMAKSDGVFNDKDGGLKCWQVVAM